jgi:soluble lytic murein transglycosylase
MTRLSLCLLLAVTVMIYPVIGGPQTYKEKAKIDRLTHAIITVESNFNPNAVSKRGAIGLMQVRYSVWGKELKEQGIIKHRNDLFDPDTNIRAGTYILKVLHVQHKGDFIKIMIHWSGGAKKFHQKVMNCMLVYDDLRNK